MIFVSYSHEDEVWRKRFDILSKPLGRSERVEFWSDKKLKAGEWEPQLERAMAGAMAAVLLVSDNFLASDYIVEKELPYLLRARHSRNLIILWAYLEPCDLKRAPEIAQFQAMTLGPLEPMSKMTDWQWKATMLKGCDMIDDHLKDLERPAINDAISGRFLPKIANVPLLSKPSRRDVEVLVYSHDKKWWRQSRVMAGTTTAKIQLGNDRTPVGTEYTVIALTTDLALTEQTYANLPQHRTRSAEIKLRRG